MPRSPQPFWKTKTLDQMTSQEWESLCDGCGRCCLVKLEDEDEGEIHLTRLSCRLLHVRSCRCSRYHERFSLMPDCIEITQEKIAQIKWLPVSCVYRRVQEGRDLAWWHPLVSGDPETVHIANASARNRTRPEGRLQIPGLMKRIVQWPTPLEKPPAKRRKRVKKSGR